jgi:hypothetical protein
VDSVAKLTLRYVTALTKTAMIVSMKRRSVLVVKNAARVNVSRLVSQVSALEVRPVRMDFVSHDALMLSVHKVRRVTKVYA